MSKIEQFSIKLVENTSKVGVGLPYRDYFRVRPMSAEEKINARFFVTWNKTGGWYLIDSNIARKYHVAGLKKAMLYETMFSDGCSWITTLTLPIPGIKNNWYPSLKNAIELAQTEWVAVTRDDENKCFAVEKSIVDFGEPVWTDETFEQLLVKAFRGRIIKTPAAAKKFKT
jgi:hypothetical protein